ncbi:MAG: hypothetical protein WBS54_14810 [Acidobacteriota bacterium]
MTTAAKCLLGLALIVATVATVASQNKVEVVKERGHVIVTLSAERGLGAVPSTGFMMSAEAKDKTIVVIVMSHTAEARWKDFNHFAIITDGKAETFKSVWGGKPESDYESVNEAVVVKDVPISVVEAMVKAKSAAFRVGATTITLTPEQVELVKQFIAKVKGGN